MSFQSMITASSIPMGSPGSLFKNPAEEGLAKFSASKDSFSVFGDAMVISDPLFDPTTLLDAMTDQSTTINTELRGQIEKLPSNLSIMTAASDASQQIQSVDSMLSDNPNAPFPDVISDAFPANGCPTPSISTAFGTITGSNAMVNDSVSSMGSSLDMITLQPVTIAIKNAGGPNITTGEQLLEYLGSASNAVKAAVTAVVAGSTTIVNSLKQSFSASITSVTDLGNTFAESVVADSTIISNSLKQLKGFSSIQMLKSNDPCVQTVMNNVIDQNMVDQKALVISDNLQQTLVPGQPSVEKVQEGTELPSIEPTIDTPQAAEVVKASPIKVPYTDNQYTSIMVPILQAQSALVTQLQKANAEWLKTNVEDWKISVNYQAKKVAAGATEANPYGTSTDPAVLAAWKAVYDVYVTKRDYFNGTLLPPDKAERKKFDEMNSEKKDRLLYGRYPYTYMNSIGIEVPPDEQYTYLDSTK